MITSTPVGMAANGSLLVVGEIAGAFKRTYQVFIGEKKVAPILGSQGVATAKGLLGSK